MGIQFSNNAGTTITTALNTTTTTLTLENSERFPELSSEEFFNATIQHPVSGYLEIVKITGNSPNFTIERGQEGTTPTDFPLGSIIELRMTAGSILTIISEKAGLLYRGLWDETIMYKLQDVVSYLGNSYVCIKDISVIKPISNSNSALYWEIIPIKGIKGDIGLRGLQGLQGLKGDTGKGFVIGEVYNSLTLLLAGSITNGEFGLVAGTLSQTHQDYGKVYLYNNDEWTYITDMSVQGAAGITGPKGPDGSTGLQGRSITMREVWRETENYSALDVVLYNGKVYICILDSTIMGDLPTDDTFWYLLSGSDGSDGFDGDTGLQGASIVMRGIWNSETVYSILDIVIYERKLYISLYPSLGNRPDIIPDEAELWHLLNEGSPGVQGIPGPAGADTITATSINDDGELIITTT